MTITLREPSLDSTSAPIAQADGAGVPSAAAARGTGKTVWIDIDNSPHVPFFLPIIHELERN
jgi:hypothetical protein